MEKLSGRCLDGARRNIKDILSLAIGHTDLQASVVVFDAQSKLAAVLTEVYRYCLPGAVFIAFEEVVPADVMGAFERLKPRDLVVLIQSTNFRLEAFRIRVELFNRSLKVIEHLHLSQMQGAEADIYLESLAYDASYYRDVGHALKNRLDRAQSAVVETCGERLVYSGGFEPAKLNVGDYSGMKNVGGQFPIGEVFTEAKDLEALNGRVRIFAFGDTAFKVQKPSRPVILTVAKGRVTDATDTTPEFEEVLNNIRADEGEIWVRELGFGMNRAFTPERIVSDVGTYERMCGVHLSLGAKHSLYKKPNFTRKAAKHHADVFVSAEAVILDEDTVYRSGAWQV